MAANNEPQSFADAIPPAGKSGDAAAITRAFHKVITDPELRAIYEKARKEQAKPEYNKAVLPALLAVRDAKRKLIHYTTGEEQRPDNLSHRELMDRLALAEAEERRLVAEFRGSRKAGETEPFLWIAQKVWPNGAEAKCPKCGKGRHVEIQELTQWLRRGLPDCKKCEVEITLLT